MAGFGICSSRLTIASSASQSLGAPETLSAAVEPRIGGGELVGRRKKIQEREEKKKKKKKVYNNIIINK